MSLFSQINCQTPDVKETKEGWNKETTELIEIAREVVQVARKIRAEKPPAPITKEETPYEKVVKTNPYISNNNITYYR